jgi:hypothetical protein
LSVKWFLGRPEVVPSVVELEVAVLPPRPVA